MKAIKTFRNIKGYTLNQLIIKEPICFNNSVDVEMYEITVKKIEEPKEVYRQRLQKLWDECENHHHWQPLKGKAKELGVELIGSAGSKRKR